MPPIPPLHAGWPPARWGVLALAVLLAGCGGGQAPPLDAPAQPPAVAAHPHYQSQTAVLTLPEVRAGGLVHVGASIRLLPDGRWVLQSAGTTRPATAADHPSAEWQPAGATQTLADANLDVTLHVRRLHFDNRVLTHVAIRLAGGRWSLVGQPQEAPALGSEDFRMNPALVAGDQHHLALDSSPDSGTQRIPLQLRQRSYRFCMDAQAQGADTLTLLDAQGTRVLSLRAGDACVVRNVTAGRHVLQHEYGGNGNRRTVFLKPGGATSSPPASARAGKSPRIAQSAAVNTAEYWMVGQSTGTGPSPGVVGYVDFAAVPWGPGGQPPPCLGGFAMRPASYAFDPASVLRVARDAFGQPAALDGVYKCLAGDPANAANYVTRGGFPDSTFFGYFLNYGLSNTATYRRYPNDPYGFRYASVQLPPTMRIQNFASDSFTLLGSIAASYWADNPPLADMPVGLSSDQSPILMPSSGQTWLMASDSLTPVNLRILYRFYTGNFSGAPVSLNSGQVAFFGGANCAGTAAIVSEVANILNLGALTNTLLNSDNKGSFLLGPATAATVFADIDNLGASQRIVSSGCVSLPALSAANGWVVNAMTIEADTVDMVVSTDACESCNLSGLNFDRLSLANVKLQRSNLAGASFHGTDLSGADLRFSSLQGASLVGSNLTSANLCGAALNGGATVQAAARLTGAHLKNANLAYTNLSGVALDNASFFTSPQAPACQPVSCSDYTLPSCASAYQATMDSTRFTGAYLAGVDMSGAVAAGADFGGAMLFGARFVGAQLDHNATTSNATSFAGAYLQGADFTNASVRFASFYNAYFGDGGGNCMQATLPAAYLGFPGLQVPGAGVSCTAPAQAPASTCVQASYAGAATLPATDCTNVCVDGSGGQFNAATGACNVGGQAACPVASWTSPVTPATQAVLRTSACKPASAALCGNPFTGSNLNTCW